MEAQTIHVHIPQLMCRKYCFVIKLQVLYFNVLNVSMDVKIRAAVIFFINKNNLLIIFVYEMSWFVWPAVQNPQIFHLQ